ncbi:uncharacterized protein ACHE_50394A [Aspergillus chevalieri]|uniref:Transcription factor hoxa13 n=1 Tax=Aspergillus chevalieri TaxID=182096 RepID=A0A7R7ZPY1_ASPCH|nr:uncharacterized protein ACHE_50394A [Aspergillus chevalieri]BCR89196.1 hypothetical protein ACHE_50394A [Aspergillus chevalieri]
MAMSENGHASDGVSKTNGRDEPRTKSRLSIWYALLTPFFRCPSQLSDLNELSPRVCKPYLVVRSHIEPHVLPYYHLYAAPYVDSARPYVTLFNEQVYSPAATYAKQGYDKYGAPAWDQAQAYGQEQWDAQVAPRLQSAQDSISRVYKLEVDPHVQHAVLVVSPYYEKASAVAISTYGDYIAPLYTQSRPFIGKTYASGQEILTTTVIPHAQHSWSTVIYFVNSSLWPKVTGLYSENVEPQLVKIGQRLASYREGKILRASVDDVDSTSEEAAHTITSASVDSSATSSAISTSTTETPAQTPLSPAEQIAQAREKVASDLQVWQEKFSAAAERGAEELKDHVNDIVGSHIASGAKSHGESLAVALDTVVADELATIKSRINSLAESLPYDDLPEDQHKANDELLKEIRRAAITIRERAQAIREWHRSFDEELVFRVSVAINSTLDILDNVRDLGLQEIGMRWAWMDGVTYKDWAKYRSLKAQFDDWKTDVSRVALEHPKLEEATNMANGLLAHGMEVAETTARELARLKDVGKWKIAARESSDNFETRSESPPALPKPGEMSDSPADEESSNADLPGVSSESQATHDATGPAPSPETVNVNAGEYKLEDDEQILALDQDSYVDDELPDDQEKSVHTESNTARSNSGWGVAAAEVPGRSPMQHDIPDDDQERFIDHPLDYISSVGSSRLSEGLSKASEQLAQVQATVPPKDTSNQNPIVLDAQRRYYEAVGLAHDHYSAFVSSASDAVYGSPAPTSTPGTFHGFIEDARSGYSQASSLASASLAAVVSSASSAASPTDSGKAQRIIDDASSRYNAAISAASASLSMASASGSSTIYGTPTGEVDALASKASENWEGLVSKASEQVYDTQAAYTQQVLEHITPKYQAVEELVSELLVGKEPDFTDKVIDRLHSIYETPYPASALSSASSYASDAYDSAVTNLPSIEDILETANKNFDNAVEAASVQIYGTPKGTVEQATSAAGSAFASASNQVSGMVYGQEPGYLDIARGAIDGAFSSADSAISNAVYASPTPSSAVEAAYDSVTSAAKAQQEALESATSKLGIAVESAQAQLVDLASSASSLGSEAVETAASRVEAFTESVKSSPSVKDEL